MTLTCHNCGKPFETDRSWPGDLVPCPSCGANVDLVHAETNIPELSPSLMGEDRPLKAEAGMALPSGSKIGQYVIEKLIGRGGMGAVYKGKHPMLDREVAVKVLPPEFAADADFVTRFKREAMALAKLQHPNIVGVHDMGVQGELYYFVMEYVEGVDLRRLLRDRTLKPEQALAIVPKLCTALEYAHARGIVHRDIKPENIIIDTNGEPKIADFGLAKIVRGERGRTLITHTDVVMGTPDYMAPEQREVTKTADHRADIYSMGVVFYEMLTGELPVGRFDPPSKKVTVDVRLDEVVLRALENSPEKRYQHAREMGDDVTRITSGPPPKAPPTPPAAPKKHAVWPVALVFGCLSLVALPIVGALLIPAAAKSNFSFAAIVAIAAIVALAVVFAVIAVTRHRGTGTGLAAGCGLVALLGFLLVLGIGWISMSRGRTDVMDERVRVAEAEVRSLHTSGMDFQIDELLDPIGGSDFEARATQAEKLCDEALRWNSADPVALRGLGRVHAARGYARAREGRTPEKEYSAAIGYFLQAGPLGPSDGKTIFHRGQTYLWQAEYRAASGIDASVDLQRATDDLIRASELDPSSAIVWVRLGDVYLMSGRHRDAGEKYERALALAPDSWEALHGRGRVRLALGDARGAGEDFNRAAGSAPEPEEILLELAACFLKEGASQDAIDTLGRILRTHPDHAAALAHRGQVYSILGRHADAVADFERAFELNPELRKSYADFYEPAKRALDEEF